MKKLLLEIIFGKPVKGEKLIQPKKKPERPLIQSDYNKWCRMLNVSAMTDKRLNI